LIEVISGEVLSVFVMYNYTVRGKSVNLFCK